MAKPCARIGFSQTYSAAGFLFEQEILSNQSVSKKKVSVNVVRGENSGLPKPNSFRTAINKRINAEFVAFDNGDCNSCE